MRLLEDIDEPPGKFVGELGPRRARLNDGEFVAAEAGQEVAGEYAAAQAFRYAGEQRVADGMPERVVDFLEVVEIDPVQGEPLPGIKAEKLTLQTLPEVEAVGNLCQGVV